MVVVNFEVAKKLKEKGFKQGFNIFGYKLIFSDENTIKYISDIGAYEKEDFGINIPCPAITQVLKCLREEKKIAVNVEFIPFVWQYKIIDMSVERRFEDCGKSFYTTYEEAALAGIEYVLDNLI